MIDPNDPTAVGEVFIRHRNNATRLACAESNLAAVKDLFVSLANQLENAPHRIDVLANGDLFFGTALTIPTNLVERVANALKEEREARIAFNSSAKHMEKL